MAMSSASPVQLQAASIKSAESRPNRENSSREADFGSEFKRELSRDRADKAQVEATVKPASQEQKSATEENAQSAENPEVVQAATVDPWLLMLQGAASNKVNAELSTDAANLATDLTEGAAVAQQGEDALLSSALNAAPEFKTSLSQVATQAKNPMQPIVTDPNAAVPLADLMKSQTDVGDAASIAADAAKFMSTSSNAKEVEPVFVNELKTSLGAAEMRAQSNLGLAQANTKVSEAPVHHIATPVGESRWGDAVAQRVGLMLGRQEQKIEMQLTPPNLGPMEVRLNLAQDQASVVFSSQNAAVREALAAAMPRLTTLLADQGFTLTNVQVASDSLQQHQQQQHQNQQAANGSGFNQQQNGSRDLGSIYGNQTGYAGEVMQELGPMRLPVAKGGLSLFV